MTIKETIEKAIAGLEPDRQVAVQASVLRELRVGNVPEDAPDSRPCNVIVRELRESLAAPNKKQVGSDSTINPTDPSDDSDSELNLT